MMVKIKINHNLEINLRINKSEKHAAEVKTHTATKTFQGINRARSNEVIGGAFKRLTQY